VPAGGGAGNDDDDDDDDDCDHADLNHDDGGEAGFWDSPSPTSSSGTPKYSAKVSNL